MSERLPEKPVFHDRDAERAALAALNQARGAQLVAIYGRRRIGKTSLLVHWLERERDTRSVYWVAHRSTSTVLLAKLSQAIQPHLGTADPSFSFSSWEAALDGLARLAEKKPLILVIDELPYLLESVPSFATVLQAAWDQRLRHSKIRVVLSGSHYHMMQDTIASPRGPLYGRTTGSLLVEELSIADMALFLPSYSSIQLVETYSVIGGVPRYLEAWNDRRPVLRNVEDAVLSPISIFRNEPSFLIQDEIADPRTYLAVLEAIGAGRKRPVEIAHAAGVQLAHIGKYLHTLETLRFVRRLVPVMAKPSSDTRTTRYEIRDPYLRFHFSFVQPNLRLLEQGRIDRLMELVRADFDAFVGRSGYEEVCRRHVAELADRGDLPIDAIDVGRAWERTLEVDVVALDRRSRAALVGECRWRSKAMGLEVLDQLQSKAKAMSRLEGYTLHYALFSRSGFTAALKKRAKAERVLLVEGVPELKPARRARAPLVSGP